MLSKYLALAAELSDSLSAEMEAGGWTVERARILLRFIGPRQRTLFELIDQGDGFVSTERLREEFGEKLNGLTGPILKHMDSLARRGLLPEGLERPIHSVFSRGVGVGVRLGDSGSGVGLGVVGSGEGEAVASAWSCASSAAG